MNEWSYLAKELDAVQEKISRDVLDLFSQHYNREKEEWFSSAHGLSDSSDYNRGDYQRIAFRKKGDVSSFVQDMKSQGVDVVATPFKLHGQYIAEIPTVQNDGRNAGEVILDFQNRYDISPQQEAQQEYEKKPLHSNIGDGLADVLLVNHLDTLGTAIHQFQNFASQLGNTQYGQTSNRDIFRSSLDSFGEASPELHSGKAKVATVLNNDVVVMDGMVVHDEAIRQNVLSQHQERLEYAEKKISHADDRISSRHLSHVTTYINQQADLVDQYQKMLDRNESLSASQMEKYENAKSLISGFEQDFGRPVSKFIK